ncbi:hypothetical protein C8Q74DRAFT_327824 [Fomes fomentarius]|nr:hypothetical protein C8Q74DRAFT_327824 [Fomes fomentarius]
MMELINTCTRSMCLRLVAANVDTAGNCKCDTHRSALLDKDTGSASTDTILTRPMAAHETSVTRSRYPICIYSRLCCSCETSDSRLCVKCEGISECRRQRQCMSSCEASAMHICIRPG